MNASGAAGSRRIGLRAKVLLAALAVSAAGLGCEVMARVVFDAPPNPFREPQIVFRRDPELGFLHVPNQAGWLDDGWATINAFGLRGPMPGVPKQPGTLSILAIGDSTTFGWGVGDDESYPAKLQEQLRQALPSRPVEVINGGVPAYDLESDLRLLRHFGPVLRPDIVVVGFYWNDLKASGGGAGDAGASALSLAGEPARDRFRMSTRPSWWNRALRSSRAAYVLRQAWLGLMAPTERAAAIVRQEMTVLEGREDEAVESAWRRAKGTLGEIAAAAREVGASVGVLVVPIRAQVEGEYPRAQYQTKVRAIADELGVFVIDPLSRLAEQPDRRGLFIPYDRVHLSARGNALMAAEVFDVLRQRPELAAAVYH